MNGGRGAFDPTTHSIPINKREYSTVGSYNGITIIEGISAKNGKTPVMSNTANTAYAVWSTTAERIKHIFFYREHMLYKAIDLEGSNSHWHYVTINPETGQIGRLSHNQNNIFQLSESQWKLVKALEKWKKK